jgi:sigma-B regulation protein RsbU (phosphoserine phosphatase)
MKLNQFNKELKGNFPRVLDSGFIVDGELRAFNHTSTVAAEDVEGLVMRLYFLSMNPEKKIRYFVNQYAENKFLYFVKLRDDAWLFVLSENSNFAKLHFYIQYLLNDNAIDFSEEVESVETSGDTQKLLSAKRIQDLLFPKMETILSKFKESYFWYRPTDIVGGDFYWAKKFKNQQWIIIGDCTGHSVEGALGSVSVMSILNQVFNPEMNPHHLIKALHSSLNDIQSNSPEDGYGIACELMVLKYDYTTKVIKYSSNGMFIHVITDKIKTFKTKKSSFDPDRVIKFIRTREIDLSDGAGIFTHSDGIPDQFNEQGKKLMRSGMINSIKTEMAVNERTIEKHFDAWKGEESQIDDVICLFLRP